jgi:hypothetical protein
MSALYRKQLVSALGLMLMVGGGCRVPPRPAAAVPNRGEEVRKDCYSLMHDLFDQQKNVSKLLLIKFESASLRHLIKAIAAASEAGVVKLEEFAAQDRSLDLKHLALPPGEVATRKSIASEKARNLLVSSGRAFEFNLLITQIEALSYAVHLTKVAAAHEPDHNRARHLSSLSDKMRDLRQQAIALMSSQSKASEARLVK